MLTFRKRLPLGNIGDKATKGGIGSAKLRLLLLVSLPLDQEAFVKVKFSELEKTAHQKKVSQTLLSQCILQFYVSGHVWTDQQHRGAAEQVQHENEHYKVKEDSLAAVRLTLYLSGDEVAFRHVSLKSNLLLQADLNPLFNWNVTQLFLYLTAEYQTPNNKLNQV